MKQLFKWIGLILLAVVVGLMLVYGFTAVVRAQRGVMQITLDQAVESANRYLSDYDDPDLALSEVMEFENNFYAEVVEQSTGVHAFELLIDRSSGAVSPEPGPNMMWNTRYGHMSGMMGGWRGRQTAVMAVTPERAREIAQGWLEQNQPGRSAEQDVDEFYGYYTIHIMQDGKINGMLSVNGYTGEVWYHNWHGGFIDMKEIGGMDE